MFVKISPRGHIILLLYDDNIIITRYDSSYIDSVKSYLQRLFQMDLGHLQYFLSLEFV